MSDMKIDSLVGGDTRLTDALWGTNSTNTRLPYERNKDLQGFTFITRPLLNLSNANLANSRDLYTLLTEDGSSIPSFVRNTLDPTIAHGNVGTKLSSDKAPVSPLVDPHTPFIPILSNTLTTLSGWPDPATPIHTSTAGVRKEQFAMVDGAYDIFDVFDLSAVFENVNNEPLTMLFHTWEKYSTLTFEGLAYPHPRMIASNEFDYNTRIYRFVMDAKNRFIKKSAATGASIPVNGNIAKFFDYNAATPISDNASTIDIKFTSMGATYNDPITLLEFNKAMYMYNPYIRAWLDSNGVDDNDIVFITLNMREEYKFSSYPIIDLNTSELKWFVPRHIFDQNTEEG